MITIKELKDLGVTIREGIDEIKLYPVLSIINKDDAKTIIDILHSHGYDLNNVHLTSLRLLSLNKKEINSLKENLDRIDSLNLREIFNSNLNASSLRSSVISRVEFCQKNGIPFAYEESNIIISEIYSEETFNTYTTKYMEAKKSMPENVNTMAPENTKTSSNEITRSDEIVLDEEDNAVRSDIIKTLLEIKEENKDNFTFGFLVTSIIANLDISIANDNKGYRTLGAKHLIERALEGIELTPEMQNDVTEKILVAFNNEMEIERSA